MKYIRTKDGRILKVFNENVPLLKENDGLTYYGKNTIDFETSCWFPKSDVINQADTIEELCDEFVKKSKEIGNDYFKIGKNDFDIFDRIYHKEDLEHYDYYGAIWTDKGLIYVAKMNDKGELELL